MDLQNAKKGLFITKQSQCNIFHLEESVAAPYNILNMKINVTHVAELANLTLTEAEKEKIEKQLISTLEYVERLSSIDTKSTKPTSQVTGLENVTREDEVTSSLSQQEALQNAKSTYKGYFKVTAVFKD